MGSGLNTSMETSGQGSTVQRDVATEDVISIPIVQKQDNYLKIFEQFESVKPLVFRGYSNGIVPQDWKMDIQQIMFTLGVDTVQMQRLSTFSLQGEAYRWRYTRQPTTQKMTDTWDKFVKVFNA